jgi:hypothetical protein
VEESVSDSNGTAIAVPDLLYVGISADHPPTSAEGLHDGFTGNMDDWQIYDYALSPSEVAHIATDGTGIFRLE